MFLIMVIILLKFTKYSVYYDILQKYYELPITIKNIISDNIV